MARSLGIRGSGSRFSGLEGRDILHELGRGSLGVAGCWAGGTDAAVGGSLGHFHETLQLDAVDGHLTADQSLPIIL